MTTEVIGDRERVVGLIREAFSGIEYPGDWCLRGSNEGEEPFLLEQEFKGKADWRTLDPAFLDQAPAGFGTALSFFSDEAFRFYLPAYLIADLDDQLQHADPVFNLCHGFDDAWMHKRINPRRYGERTWRDWARFKFAMFTQPQVTAIVAYLRVKERSTVAADPTNAMIDHALRRYWLERAKGGAA
jgi:hypothetical protein